MKKAVLIFLCFLSFKLHAQVEKVGDKVCMDLQTYRAVRYNKMVCDTMKIELDSLVMLQDEKIKVKDTIILNLVRKNELKDSLITEKNNTINILSSIDSRKTNRKFDISLGAIGGMLLAILLMR